MFELLFFSYKFGNFIYVYDIFNGISDHGVVVIIHFCKNTNCSNISIRFHDDERADDVGVRDWLNVYFFDFELSLWCDSDAYQLWDRDKAIANTRVLRFFSSYSEEKHFNFATFALIAKLFV